MRLWRARASAAGSDSLLPLPSIDQYLTEARSRLKRVEPEDLDGVLDQGAVLIDIRPAADRERRGAHPRAISVERNVLEWRLAPSSDARIGDFGDGRRVILMCNEGYQSSLSAAILQDLGVEGATDLVGGYEAYADWRGSR